MGRRNNSRTQNRNYKRKMRVYNQRGRLFNGNVRSPGEFIFIWALILVYIVGMWIFLLNLGLNKRDYVQAELIYEGSYRKEDSIVLTLSGAEYKAWASMCDLDGIYALKKGERLSVITAKEKVISIKYYDKVLLAQEDAERDDAEGKRSLSLIFGIFAAVWAVFVAVSVWVMCNAHRLPMWLVKGFVKPSYLTRPPKR